MTKDERGFIRWRTSRYFYTGYLYYQLLNYKLRISFIPFHLCTGHKLLELPPPKSLPVAKSHPVLPIPLSIIPNRLGLNASPAKVSCTISTLSPYMAAMPSTLACSPSMRNIESASSEGGRETRTWARNPSYQRC